MHVQRAWDLSFLHMVIEQAFAHKLEGFLPFTPVA